VVGGGPGGEVAAGRCSECGLETALVEAELAGKEGSYWACMPSKTLLRPGKVLLEARRASGACEAVTGSLDAAAALRRRDGMGSRSINEVWLHLLEEFRNQTAKRQGEAP